MEHRGYKIESQLVGPAGYRIRRIGPGGIPMDLSGTYTTTKFAQLDIDRYEDSRPPVSVVLQDLPPRKTKDATPRVEA